MLHLRRRCDSVGGVGVDKKHEINLNLCLYLCFSVHVYVQPLATLPLNVCRLPTADVCRLASSPVRQLPTAEILHVLHAVLIYVA